MIGNEIFSLDSYDCIGFDLDNTLVQYVEFELVSFIYDLTAKYLIEHFDYNSDDILKPITYDIDFLRKGLTLDVERGNIVSLSEDGTVLRASHGFNFFTTDEIRQIYEPNGKWNLAAIHCDNFLQTWNGEWSNKIRSFLDYFDMCLPLLFARLINSIESRNETITSCDIWSHILQAVMHIYRNESFENESGEYYREVKKNPTKFLKKCSKSFLDWLQNLKLSGKITFVITGSRNDYANFIAEHGLCKEWNKFFDVIIYYAKKPGFFVKNRPFLFKNTKNIAQPLELKLNSSYEEGNWTDLRALFSKETGKSNPKCLYIGDNLIQDIYAPAKYHCCDTIAVVQELMLEYKYDELLDSKKWGTFFYDDEHQKNSIWGKIIASYSKICIPSVDWFIDQSLRKKYNQLK
ncbi:hypothetical protein PGB90_004844 [Kerria lacca]